MSAETAKVPEEWARAAEHAYAFTPYAEMAEHAWPNVVRALHRLIAAQVRAQALADAWWAVHISRHGPKPGGGPDNFYNGAYTAKGCIEALPGFDKDVEPEAVSAYQQRRNLTPQASRSGKLGGDPGGVGSTNRGLTPPTAPDGSES